MISSSSVTSPLSLSLPFIFLWFLKKWLQNRCNDKVSCNLIVLLIKFCFATICKDGKWSIKIGHMNLPKP
eukprot:c49393_g1_i1 orf=2-208(-)